MSRIFTALLIFLTSNLMLSCVVSKNYSPAKKFPQNELREDYSLLRNILETKHPSLYWYTPKDSMDWYFDKYYQSIPDSMTDQQFAWHILAPLVDKIHCGHTSVGSSKAYQRWAKDRRLPSFPLYFKVWNDTMSVMSNLNRNDSIFRKGVLVTSVNGISNKKQIDKMFDYLPEDGYANNVNYIRLSANFPYYHRNIYGLSKKYRVSYLDSSGKEKTAEVPLFTPKKDTTKKDSTVKRPRPKRPDRPKVSSRAAYRSMSIDSGGQSATLTLNTFNKGHLRPFFRRSFRTLKQKEIKNLVIDVRSNGGGKVWASTLLTKYISRSPFKVADSAFAVAKGLGKYSRYIKWGWLNSVEMFFISGKQKDGLYHIRMMEKKVYDPKKRNHFDGKVYVLTNGPTFSASALFCNAVKGQDGVVLLGEETGGGWHGNSGIMIPDIKLPHTRNTVRLPLYRIVQYKHVPKTGSGIPPDIYVGTNYDALLKGIDYKMQVVKEIINNGKDIN
jgi:hypothetical protein